MPGSGKSYLGRLIAHSLKLQFVDLDDLIEKHEHKMIKHIVQEQGETYFRELEKKMLHETQLKNKLVISCGGGTPIFYDNIDWMKKNGIVIWIHTPLRIISERIFKNITRRPLFIGLSKEELNMKLIELSEKRTRFYKKANITIAIKEQTKLPLSSVIQQVIKYSKKFKR